MMYRKLQHSPLSQTLRNLYRALPSRGLAHAAAGLGALTPVLALANPTGGQVVAGTATFSAPAANGLVVNQGSERAVINWQQFSIGSGEYVQFIQPNSSAVALNRVTGSNPSSIFGDLRANGQVFLINPNGILFAPGSSLDVQGLVASTQDLNNSAFMQGSYAFSRVSGAPDATVVNRGKIQAGYGGYVVLAGDYVENDGSINAQSGRVYLAAGDQATLTLDKNQLVSYVVNGKTLAQLAGVDNTGTITANGGAVVMTADVANALTATAVNNSGLIAAHSAINQGGAIMLLAQGGGIENSGTLDASGGTPGARGGTIIVRGNGHTQLMADSKIETGGYDARGGFIELSGHTLHVAGHVIAGHGGSLLIDPSTITIIQGSGSPFGTTAHTTVHSGSIANQLKSNVNVALVASNNISWSGGARTLTAAGAGKLTLEIGTVTGCTNGVCVGGTPVITPGAGTINLGGTTGLSINIKGAFTAIAGMGNVTLGNVTAGAITITGNRVVTGALHATGPAASGNVAVTGSVGSHTSSNGGDVTINGSVTADNGSVALHGRGGGDSSGGDVIVTGDITAAGAVAVSGAYTGSSKADGGGRVSLANVTGKSVSITVFSSSPQITVKNVTATGAGGSIMIRGSGSGSGTGSRDGHISAGALTASNGHGHVNVSLSHLNAAANVTTGAINAPLISVFLDGNGDVATGPITAVSTAASANVFVDAFNGAAGAANHVIVNGNITAKGKTPGTGTGPISNGFGVPAAAQVVLEASGSCAACAHDVKVQGSVVVTASGRHFTHTNINEVGPVTTTTSGSGGLGVFTAIGTAGAGSADITGDITVAGPAAAVSVRARDVTVHNVTVTGQGQNISTVTHQGTNNALVFSSHNSAGAAVVELGGGGSSAGVTQKLTAGNISVSGKGFATAGLYASNVSAGDVVVSATAAKGSIHGGGGASGPGNLFSGITTRLDNGSIDAGLAFIEVAQKPQSAGSGAPAASVRLGNVSVTGVGRADIEVDAKAVSTQALTAAATKGAEKGTGSSQSGVTAVNTYTHSYAINGGEANVRIHSGSSGSGVLTQNGGPVTVGGAVTVTGPVANVDIQGKTIRIGGNVTVTGSGESFMSDTVFKPAAGTGYHVHVTGASGPTGVFLQGAASGSVSVAGKTAVKGPGLVGAFVLGGNVKLHGLAASASASVNYSVLDTRVSATADNFTAGSVTLAIADAQAVGGQPVFTSASNAGDVVVKAKGDVNLAAQMKISGGLNVRAGGNIFGNSNSAVSRISALTNSHPRAGNHSGSSGGPSPGGLPVFAADANAVFMQAGGNIDLTGSKLAIGNGTVLDSNGQPVQAGDAILLAGLAELGIAPTAVNPNGTFIAGGALTLDGLNLSGSYLYLQAAAVSILGAVSVPAGALVQVQPFAPTIPIDIGGTASAVTHAATSPADFTLGATFLSLFPHATVAVGGVNESGIVTINGPLSLGDTNLVIFTTGTVTGLGTVTSTGLVISLLSVLGPPIPPVTAGEVDPSTTGDQTDKRNLGLGDDTGSGGTGGTISEDTGTSSVCH